MSKAERYERHRRRELPQMLEATRAKHRALVQEAIRYDMEHLLDDSDLQVMSKKV